MQITERESLAVSRGRDWLVYGLTLLLAFTFFYISVIAVCQYFGVNVPNIMWTIGDMIALAVALFFGLKVILVTLALSDIYISIGEKGAQIAKRSTYFIVFVMAFITLVIGIAGSSRAYASLGTEVN
nr:hypothetical protein [Sicyoidochytrium minutum DNA virus]